MVKFTYTGATLLCCQAACSSALAVRAGSRPTVTIDAGVLIGTSEPEPKFSSILSSILSSTILSSTHPPTVHKFLGIPFAKPPARWKLPEKPDPWPDALDASQFGNACHQQFGSGYKNAQLLEEYFNSPPAPVPDSEDCLYLNVFAPASASPGSNKAVMFWIHGGTDSAGTAALPQYDGTNLAVNQDVVVVTINYRLNIFGFPSSPDIPVGERNFG